MTVRDWWAAHTASPERAGGRPAATEVAQPVVTRARPQAPPVQGGGGIGTTAAQRAGDSAAREHPAPAYTPNPVGRALFPKHGKSGGRFALYRRATTVGEFFKLHTGTACDAAQDLRNDLTWRTRLCVIPGFTLPKDLRITPPRLLGAAQARASGRPRHVRAADVPSAQGDAAEPARTGRKALATGVAHPGATIREALTRAAAGGVAEPARTASATPARGVVHPEAAFLEALAGAAAVYSSSTRAAAVTPEAAALAAVPAAAPAAS